MGDDEKNKMIKLELLNDLSILIKNELKEFKIDFKKDMESMFCNHNLACKLDMDKRYITQESFKMKFREEYDKKVNEELDKLNKKTGITSNIFNIAKVIGFIAIPVLAFLVGKGLI
jgi:hypothetical protein